MKRYIVSNISADRLDTIQQMADKLAQLFKDKSLQALVYYADDSEHRDYWISRKLSGRGLQMYCKITDGASHSYGGGVSIAEGPWDIAQNVLNIEPNLDLWNHKYNYEVR